MSTENILLKGKMFDVLFACQLVDKVDGYSYVYQVSTTTNELNVKVYYSDGNSGVRRRIFTYNIYLKDADVMEDFKDLEIRLLDLATKKASVVTADY